MKLKLKSENKGLNKDIIYDVEDIFPVGDGFIGVELKPTDTNFDNLARNTLNRVFSSSYGENKNLFKLVDVKTSLSNNNVILFLLKVV